MGLLSASMSNPRLINGIKSTRLQLILAGVLLTVTGVCSAAAASDYAREKRFADEVTAQLVVGDAVMVPPLETVSDGGAPSSYRPFLGLYTAGKPGMPAVVLAHGVGTHPDDGLTGSLRLRLNDLGYTTLAIQMPIAAKEATVDDYFPALFPEAGARLQAASVWLRGKGHNNIALVSHTFGSWMANVYFDKNLNGVAQDKPYQAWVCISLTGGYSFAVRNYPFPVLDLYGENDIPVTVSSAWRRNGMLRLGSPRLPAADDSCRRCAMARQRAGCGAGHCRFSAGGCAVGRLCAAISKTDHSVVSAISRSVILRPTVPSRPTWQGRQTRHPP